MSKYSRFGVIALLIAMTLVYTACSSGSGSSDFPTGTFVSSDGITMVDFNDDGTCRWYYAGGGGSELHCKYGVNGALYTEMTFEYPSGPQVPATYYWTFDGENLRFELWGEDLRPSRKYVYSKTYTMVE